MDKYEQYIKERSGLSLYEDKDGFFTYQIENNCMFIQDLFVAKHSRKSGVGKRYSDLIDKIAKENGCDKISCTVCVRAKNYIDSFNFIKKMGYQVFKNEYTLVFLVKEL